MKKRLLVAIMATAAITMGCGSGDSDGGVNGRGPAMVEPAFAINDQIAIIVDNKDTWFLESEYDIYNYAITDLDQDGYIELIESSCQGSGIFTYSSIYEVNDNHSLTKVEYEGLDEYDSQPDIIRESMTCYFDSSSNTYYYVVSDTLREGAAGYFVSNYGMSLKDDGLMALDYYSGYFDGMISETEAGSIYYDADNKEITEREYNEAENRKYASLNKMTCNINWIANPGYNDDFNNLLLESWQGFGII